MAEGAEQMAEELRQADVVLTTYAVLAEEVNFTNEERSLRHAKRYKFAEGPLMRVWWWRLVLDEAQYVGTGLRAVGRMAHQLRSQHRWMVTGTPVGPGGLSDVQGLLYVLRHDPFQDLQLWRHVIARPYQNEERGARDKLAHVLKPIMWRNDKQSTRGEVLLPLRTLQEERVEFTTGEASFYEQILDGARQELEALAHHDQVEAVLAHSGTAVQQRNARHKREKLEAAAAAQVAQARKCCDHAQLTDYWKSFHGDLQLHQGGALSIGEIMDRMALKIGRELQAAERDLVSTISALASLLLATPSKAKGSSTKHRALPGQAMPPSKDDEEARTPSPGPSTPSSPKAGPSNSKKRKLEVAQPPSEQVRKEVLELLQMAYKVAEHGIGALLGCEDKDIHHDSASWRAWKPIQVNINTKLANLYEELGSKEEAEQLREAVRTATEEVLEGPSGKRAEAATALDGKMREISQLTAAIRNLWDDAREAGWPPQERSAAEWLVDLESRFLAAQEAERSTRVQKTRGPQVLLGTVVTQMLQTEEVELAKQRNILEALLGRKLVAETLSRLRAAESALSSHAGTPGADPTAFLEVAPEVVVPQRSAINSPLESLLRGCGGLSAGPHASALRVGQVSKAVENAVRLLKAEDKKWMSQLELGEARGLQRLPVLALFRELEGLRERLNLIRALRERHTAELSLELAQSEVEEVTMEMAAAATQLPNGPRSHNGAEAELRDTHDTLKSKCVALLHRHRFFSNQARGLGTFRQDLGLQDDNPEEGNDDPIFVNSTPAPTQADSPRLWSDGVRATTGISAVLGSWGPVCAVVVPPSIPEPALAPSQTLPTAHPDVKLDSTAFVPPAEAPEQPAELSCFVATEGNSFLDVKPDQGTVPPAGPAHEARMDTSSEAVLANQNEGAHADLKLFPTDGSSFPPSEPPELPILETGAQSVAPPVPAAASPEAMPSLTIGRGAVSAPGAELDRQRTQEPAHGNAADGPVPNARMAHAVPPATPSHTGQGPAQQTLYRIAEIVPHGTAPHTAVSQTHDVAASTSRAEWAAQARADGDGDAAEAAFGDAEQQRGSAGADVDIERRVEETGEALEQVCGVCFNAFQENMWLFPCGHFFCGNCARQVLATTSHCPNCRADVRMEKIFRCVVRSAMDPVKDDPLYAQIPVVGAWLSKIEALLRRLKYFAQTAPEEKHLVFSQWPEALMLVGKALDVQQPRMLVVRMAGGTRNREALRKFQEDPDVRIMLLGLRSHNSGLTLVRANHVHLLDPCLEPAFEQQAIARVHRVGQSRPVFIHRYIVSNTIEEVVVRMAERKAVLLAPEGAEEEVEGDEGTAAPLPVKEHVDATTMRCLLNDMLSGK
eukprot:jgi/Botrbrau1/2217/Bobra.101_2s0046.1